MTTESAADAIDAAPPDGASPWVAEQVAALREHADRLRHETDVMRSAVHEEQRTVEGLRDLLAAIDQRVRGLETEQQSARSSRHRAEASLGEFASALARLDERVYGLEQHVALTDARRSDAAGAALPPTRIEEMEARLDALSDLAALARESAERLNADLPDMRGEVSGLDNRMETALAELRRLGDEVAQERARRDVETDLLEVINQQRAARVRMEEQVALFGEQLEEARQRLGAAADERAALARQAARADERLLMLAEALETQRDAIIEHFERLLDAERAAALKQVEGIEGGLRAGRELLTKLREESDPASAEPPL